MLIVSKFRDYYDASVGYGIDKTIIYERETSVVKSKAFFLDDYLAGDGYFYSFKRPREVSQIVHEWKILGFCGKTYVVMLEKSRMSPGEILECFYGEDALEQVFPNSKEKWRYKETRDFIRKWHNREFVDFFYENKVPVFVAEPLVNWNYKWIEVTLNSPLAEFKFFRIFDSYTAFQEIQMFISGVIGINTSNTTEIDDKNKIIQHGFDTKWSFRNPDPPKRKQK